MVDLVAPPPEQTTTLPSLDESSTITVLGDEISAEFLLELVQVVGFTLTIIQHRNCFLKSNFLGL